MHIYIDTYFHNIVHDTYINMLIQNVTIRCVYFDNNAIVSFIYYINRYFDIIHIYLTPLFIYIYTHRYAYKFIYIMYIYICSYINIIAIVLYFVYCNVIMIFKYIHIFIFHENIFTSARAHMHFPAPKSIS